MKRGSEESQTPLLMEPDSANVYDFFYVDRARISTLYAQLFPQGTLTSVKTTSQQSFSDEKGAGTDVKILKADVKSAESGSEGIEHLFDASWSIPLEVLARLKDLSMVRNAVRGSGLGSIILTDCYLRVIDFTSVQALWEPAMKLAVDTGQAVQWGLTHENVPPIGDMLKAMSSTIHAHFLTNDAAAWSSLRPENLTISVSDLTLKYGGTISGLWKVLYILDAWPDGGEPPNIAIWSGGQLIDAILTAMHGLRTIMGRPPNWVGITPLMIFRSAEGWHPPTTST
ncbi:MAG TPA: hypothetical protein VN924_24180 [Bryobacteraceae bacterium]|nr:hypothetical protein [Bryobacteraceae bacterium]